MTGLRRLRAGFARVRMSVGRCGELRRSEREMPVFRRGEEAPQGPYFGSWF